MALAAFAFLGFRERLLADPSFFVKLGIEIGIGACRMARRSLHFASARVQKLPMRPTRARARNARVMCRPTGACPACTMNSPTCLQAL